MAARRKSTKAKRRAAALRAVEQRRRAKRTKERAKRSAAGKLGWGTRSRNARIMALGKRFEMHASNFTTWQRQDQMIRNNAPEWLKFYDLMRRAGFSSRHIYDEWFSPTFL